MPGSRKFCQSESNFYTLFLFNEGRDDPNTTISGPSSAPDEKRHLSDVSLECRYWPYIKCSFVIFRGPDQLLKKLCFCDILEGLLRTPSPPSPHLDPRMAWTQSEAGHYYVWLDLVQTVCIKFILEKFSQEHHQ